MWKYKNPVSIRFSDNFMEELKDSASAKEHVLILCYSWFVDTDEYKLICDYLKNIRVFSDIEPDPSFQSCDKAVRFALESKPDTIIAIGGGSVIDTAKVVRLSLCIEYDSILNLFSSSFDEKKLTRFIAIPTTHGTSSELTKWATVWDKDNKKKYSLSDDINYPDYAIYDSRFVKNLPLEISISTTLDSMSHSFEAMWNNNANPISDTFAIKAIKLIYDNLPGLGKNTDIIVRQNLMEATVYAGMAFSNTKTAAAHSISYPLTSLYGIPHGIACSMTINSLMELNRSYIEEKVNLLLQETGCGDFSEFWSNIYRIVSDKVGFRLSDYNIKEEDLNDLVKHCFNKDRIGNNIHPVKESDVFHILKTTL